MKKAPTQKKYARVAFIVSTLIVVFVASIPSMPLTPVPSSTPVLMPTSAPTPAPVSTPLASPAPTSSPTPIPTPVPAPTIVPAPISASSPTPVLMPTSTPTPAPAPTPLASPVPASSPTPIPTSVSAPAIVPAPTPTPVPAQTPAMPSVPSPVSIPTSVVVSAPTSELKSPTPEQKSEIKPITPTDQKITTTAEEERKEIYLNFENTELASFIEYIAELKKFNIIPDKTLEGSKISLTIREPLSVEGAYNVFLTVLEMAGFSIIKVGAVHKIIPKDKKLNQPLPAYINVPYDQLPDSDQTIRYVVFLTNINVEAIQSLLEGMLSQPNVVFPYKEMNAFVITDKSYNIKSAVKLIQELDQMGLPESVTVLRLKRANASDVKELFDALLKGKQSDNPIARLLGKAAVEGGTEYFSSTTRIIAEVRTNSLILMGTTKSIDKIIDFITKHIDTEIKEAESPLHIYELQYIDAKQVADILKEITQIPESKTGQEASKYGSIRGGVKYFRNMNFQVDTDGNRLLISCVDKQDWKLLEKTIQDLDKPQPQVAIETMLVTITSDDTKELGGMIRNKKHGQIGHNVDAQSASLRDSPSLQRVSDSDTSSQPVSLLGSLLNQLVATQGQTLLTFGKPGAGIWGVFHMVRTLENASILSQPFLTVANKTTASVEVGETDRVISEKTADGLTGYVDTVATTKLDITPQINLEGVISLKVTVNITDFGTDPTTKFTKSVDTSVTVADGQVLVLGGFVRTQVNEKKNKTPILGDIPILGWFFKNQQRITNKEYIFMFICPTIIKPRQSPGMQLYTKMKLHQATDDIEDSVETKQVRDPIHNWFFNPDKENYSHKVIDFANARYQPTTVDIRSDPYYHAVIKKNSVKQEKDIVEPSGQEPSSIKVASGIQQVETAGQKALEPIAAASMPMAEVKSPIIPQASTPMETVQATLPVTPVSSQMQTVSDQKKDVIDDELVQRRNKLKALLSTSKPTVIQEQKQDDSVIDDISKRNALKQFLTAPPTNVYLAPQSQQQAHLSADTEQRNTLKRFLSASGLNKTNKYIQSEKVAA